MSQTRIFFQLSGTDAAKAFRLLDAAFEDDGYALANIETDEDSGIFEISLYCETDVELVDSIIERMRQQLTGFSPKPEISTEELPDIDWVAKSLEGLKPVRAGRFLVHGSHDRDAVRIGDIAIEIEAAQAFGTGHHGTTSGCLMMIERLVRRHRPHVALDLGTGSAVLAIALAKLTRTPVLGTDIDPIAVEVANRNAALNGVANLVESVTADGFHHPAFRETGPFDLIIANILPKPLMAMAHDIEANLAYGGDVILSGILVSQRWRVLAAFRNAGLVHRQTITREGWVTIHLSRGGTSRLEPFSPYAQNKGRFNEPPLLASDF